MPRSRRRRRSTSESHYSSRSRSESFHHPKRRKISDDCQSSYSKSAHSKSNGHYEYNRHGYGSDLNYGGYSSSRNAQYCIHHRDYQQHCRHAQQLESDDSRYHSHSHRSRRRRQHRRHHRRHSHGYSSEVSSFLHPIA